MLLISYTQNWRDRLNKLIITLCLLFASTNLLAFDIDSATGLFHERMVERSTQVYENASFDLIEDIPEKIQNKINESWDEIIDFADTLDLYSHGFSYQLNQDVYEVTNIVGEKVGYTFSIIISKHGEVSTVGFYELARRVDGEFYLAREPSWY